MRLTSLLLLAMLSYVVSQAQQETYPTLTKNAAREKLLMDACSLRFQSDLKRLDGPYKKYLTEIYRQRYDLIRAKFTGNEVITDDEASAYLMNVIRLIAKGNPLLNVDDLRVVFSNAWWPNASSMGEGTILFNIGLFHRLQNESQVAFVLCHELAHYYLNHSNNNIQQYVNTVYDDAFQKQLKAIQRSGYRQNQQVESIAQILTFKSRRHSRAFEHAADSMALSLMKNTAFDLNGALTCLAILDSVDREKYENPLQLEKRFDFPSLRFKKSWTESDALMFAIGTGDGAPAQEADSLKTHPDCASRIRKLEGLIKQYHKPDAKQFLVSQNTFVKLVTAFDFEMIDACFENKNISRCLYFTLKMLAVYPDNAWLHTMVGKCLNEIYVQQKAHQLGKIVDLPNSEYSGEYNKLLHLIQNVRLREVAGLSYYYLQQHQNTAQKEKDFASVSKEALEHFNN